MVLFLSISGQYWVLLRVRRVSLFSERRMRLKRSALVKPLVSVGASLMVCAAFSI